MRVAGFSAKPYKPIIEATPSFKLQGERVFYTYANPLIISQKNLSTPALPEQRVSAKGGTNTPTTKKTNLWGSDRHFCYIRTQHRSHCKRLLLRQLEGFGWTARDAWQEIFTACLSPGSWWENYCSWLALATLVDSFDKF